MKKILFFIILNIFASSLHSQEYVSEIIGNTELKNTQIKKELSVAYIKLNGILAASDVEDNVSRAKSLDDAQKKWIQYRDSSCVLLSQVSMVSQAEAGIVESTCQLDFNVQRVKTLRKYANDLNGA